MSTTDSRQRTVPVTCATSARTMSGGSLTGLTSALATTGTTGRFTSTVARAAAIASAAGCISAQWKGAETDSIMARRAPISFAISTPRPTARLHDGDHDLSATIVVGSLANLALRSLRRNRCRLIEVEAKQCRHGADADRHCLLHRATADAQEARGVGNGERSCGGER